MLNQAVHQLKNLRLSAMANRLSAWQEDPANQTKSQIECIMALAEAQAQAGMERKLKRFHVASGLPMNVSVAAVRCSEVRGLPRDLWANLQGCDWVGRGQNLVITGPCRSGKTLIAGALARETILRHPKARVVYRKAHELIAEIAQDQEDERLRKIQHIGRINLLVLDEFGGCESTERECQILHHIVDARHCNRLSTVVTSAYPVAEWASGFHDKTSAEAITWRLLERSQRLTLIPDPSPRA